MKRVLLTGGGGAIGLHVIWHFLEKTDWEIVVIDSFRHKGDPSRIQYLKKEHPEWESRIQVIKHDLCCPISQELAKEIGDVDYILHLAALSDVFWSITNPVYTITNNVNSTLVMLEYAKVTPHEAFIYFSTDEVYGPVVKGEGHPEWDTHRPSNPYSASKAASEDICYSYWRSGEVNLIITNTMNNFGETQAPSKFPCMIQQNLAEGKTIIVHASNEEIGTRFYIYSRDAADALLFILQNLPAHKHELGMIDDPDRYHVVGSVCLDNLELVNRIAAITGETPKIEIQDFHSHNPAHDIHYGLQDNKLRSLGWSEPIGFDAAMEQVVNWERENL